MSHNDVENVCRSRVWCSPRRSLLPVALLVVLALAAPASGQDAIVHRHLILRAQPATTSASLGALEEGTALSLVEPQPKKGFYHVRTMDGSEGWARASNIPRCGGIRRPGSSATAACGHRHHLLTYLGQAAGARRAIHRLRGHVRPGW